MKTGKKILESCKKRKKEELKDLTNRQMAIIDELTEEMFSKGLTRMDLPEDFGKPTDATMEYVNKTLELVIYAFEVPASISLLMTDIDELGKLN